MWDNDLTHPVDAETARTCVLEYIESHRRDAELPLDIEQDSRKRQLMMTASNRGLELRTLNAPVEAINFPDVGCTHPGLEIFDTVGTGWKGKALGKGVRLSADYDGPEIAAGDYLGAHLGRWDLCQSRYGGEITVDNYPIAHHLLKNIVLRTEEGCLGRALSAKYQNIFHYVNCITDTDTEQNVEVECRIHSRMKAAEVRYIMEFEPHTLFTVKATGPIKAGAELRTDYGVGYWASISKENMEDYADSDGDANNTSEDEEGDSDDSGDSDQKQEDLDSDVDAEHSQGDGLRPAVGGGASPPKTHEAHCSGSTQCL
jgi:hypothetical protein